MAKLQYRCRKGLLAGLLLILLSQGAQAREEVDVWQHIDRINQQLQHEASKKLPHTGFQLYLEDANQLIRSDAFDVEYQNIREDAFARNDFAKADVFSKRAAPAFHISFDGDYDNKQISLKFFQSIAQPGSIDSRFLDLYQQYDRYLFSSADDDHLADKSCGRADTPYIAFDFPMGYEEKGNINRKKLLAEYKTLSAQMEPGFMRNISLNAIRCLQVTTE